MINHRQSVEPARPSTLQRFDGLNTPSAEPFDKITSLVRRVLNVPIAVVSLVDCERKWFRSIEGLDATETARSISFCSHTIMGLRPLAIADATKDERFKNSQIVQGPPHIRGYAASPLQTPDGYNIGALCAIDTIPRIFSQAQLDLLTSFADLVVEEVALRRIADRDHLTGTLSRRGFIREAKNEIERFQRSQYPSFLALMDLDHFKAINDEFGHLAGDVVLKTITETCTAQLKESDVFGRLGGEEFGILFTGSDENGARSAIEKIRQAVERQLVPLANGIRVTASFGLAAIRRETSTLESWIAEADEALYRAKRSGRNRIVFAA